MATAAPSSSIKQSADLIEWLKKSTKASGVPLKIKDKNGLRKLAQMLK